MALEPGTRLGPYEIGDPVGAGGMGEVYRARDTRLDRTVAVKVLPAHRAEDETARARLEREARSVSSLSHPNICALYDLGHESGVDYLVMEYLEGETLDRRLEAGPLPVAEALRVAVQIVDALAAAHRQGVVHRDLKPANVMLTKSGTKLLDFGLAKAFDAGPGIAGGLTAMVTATTPLTTAGAILGTFQYMAPEQLEGREADARSDLFAFGAVLYEMLTGRRAFSGATQASLVAAILKEEPRPVTALAAAAPPPIDRLVARCLAKDPDERWHSASDLAYELRAIAEGGSVAGGVAVAAGAAAPRAGRSRGGRLGWWVAGLFAVGCAVLGFLLSRGPAPAVAERVEFHVGAPDGGFLRPNGVLAGPVAVSPDGDRMVFGAIERNGGNRLALRALESAESRLLPGTEGATRPFWSPDGRSIAFFKRGQLMRMDVAGGPALPVCDAPDGRGGSWSAAGVIVLAMRAVGPIFSVPENGGTPEPVTELDESRGQASHRYPQFLPDGKTFVYLVLRGGGAAATGAESENELWAASIDGGEPRLLLRGAANAQYVAGDLLFFRGDTVMARAFDPGRLEFTGEMRVVASEVQYDAPYERGVFAATPRTLVYRKGSFGGLNALRWYRPDGVVEGDVGPRAPYADPELSPDGRRLAFSSATEDNTDIWIEDLASGRRSRVTFDTTAESQPRWSPDGRRLAYTRSEVSGWSLVVGSADGDEPPQRLFYDPDLDPNLVDWTSDGRRIVFAVQQDGWRLGVVDGQAGGEPEWVSENSEGTIEWPRLSPDDRWLAYASDASGRWEVYLTTFPSGEGTWQVSLDGGLEPTWSVDGKSLYYRTGNGMIARAEIGYGSGVPRVGRVTPLFETLSSWDSGGGSTFDVAADGRILVVVASEEELAVPYTVVLNWR